MARHAIHRRLLLLVALDAISHRQIHFSLGHRLCGHIAVARRALNARANVRRVVELHMRRWLEVIDALPGNVLAPRSVGGYFFDLRLIFGNHLVAGHAEVHARDPRIRPLIDAHMAIRALQAIGQVNLMRKGDRLDRSGPRVEKFLHRVENRRVRRSVHSRVLRRSFR